MTIEEGSNLDKVVQHLIELRRRLFFIFFSVSICFVLFFYFATPLFSWLSAPLLQHLPDRSQMIATSLTSTVVVPMKLAFILALFVNIPFLFYQLWSFVAPGLYAREQRAIWPLLLASTGLFYCGVAFAYWVAFPLLFKFFIDFAPSTIQVMPDMAAYISFCLKLLMAFGISFEVPIIIFLLVKTGICSIDAIKKQRPYVFVGAFIVGMLLTPPDVLSQILLALPLYGLVELGLITATLSEKKRRARNEAS